MPRRSPRQWASQTWEATKFHVSRPNWDEVVSEDLPFGPAGEAVFTEGLRQAHNYLEFGAGSSTLAAIRLGVDVVSVESDRAFLGAIERRIRDSGIRESAQSLELIHADIGRTGPWGKPVFPSISRPRSWARYPTAPWTRLGQNYRADMILVDGRFRVACALAVILHQPESNWMLLVDDYLGRSHYEDIAKFADFRGMHGRMAEFSPDPRVDRDDAQKAFEHFSSDWR